MDSQCKDAAYCYRCGVVCVVQGLPSGEAFIQMDSEYAAELAATTKTRKLYVINGAKRYVDVIQCCGDDMNVALNNGLSPPSPAGTLPTHALQ